MPERQYGELGGVLCPGKSCGQEVFRLLGGVCTTCHKNGIKQEEVREQRRAHLTEQSKKHGLWTFKAKKKARVG